MLTGQGHHVAVLAIRLPDLPTTTIGSSPQTEDVRTTRAHYRKGKITQADYEAFLRKRDGSTLERHCNLR